MTDKTFTEALDIRIEAVRVVLDRISREGGDAALSDLRILLLSALSLVTRDPGVEQAADDVAASAFVVVRSQARGERPDTRSMRLFMSSRERLLARLENAAGRGENESVRFRGLEAAYAVQLERDAVETAPTPFVSAVA
jgi:hypothetical protein